MSKSNFSEETIAFLATLGWKAEDFRNDFAAPTTVRHATHDSLVARRPSHRSKSQHDLSVFVLDYTGKTYHDLPSPESKVIDTAKPQWRKAVMLWFTRSVFTAEQIALRHANEEAEAEVRRKRRDEALQRLIPHVECTRGTVDDIEATGSIHINDEGRPTGVSPKSYLDWRFPITADNAQRVRMLAEITLAFRRAGFVRAGENA